MANGNEAFARVVIDAQLTEQDWNTQDQRSVRYEYTLPDGSRLAWPFPRGYRGQALVGER